jgi:hypothetical protein
MMYAGETAEQMRTPPQPTGTWVDDVLESDQLSTAKPRIGRRMLSRRTVIVLWTLRIYVLLMLLLIALQMWNALHAGG